MHLSGFLFSPTLPCVGVSGSLSFPDLSSPGIFTETIVFFLYLSGVFSLSAFILIYIVVWWIVWRRCNTCNSHRLRFSNSKKFLFLFNQRNISFVNDISLKTMRLGVLMWENLNKPYMSQLSKWKLCCDSLEILSILIG